MLSFPPNHFFSGLYFNSLHADTDGPLPLFFFLGGGSLNPIPFQGSAQIVLPFKNLYFQIHSGRGLKKLQDHLALIYIVLFVSSIFVLRPLIFSPTK